MAVNKIQQSANWLQAKTVERKAKQNLDKNDFMNLFLTQMSHQDPINPMDSGSMMAQLSQLGSMEQLQKLNKGMQQLNATDKNIQELQSVNLLNHDVSVAKPQLQLENGLASPLHYTLPDHAKEVHIAIRRKDGSLVRQDRLKDMPAGRQEYVWNGQNSKNIRMEDGQYDVSLEMMTNEGAIKQINPYANIRLDEVSYADGKATFKAKAKQYKLDEITGISNHSDQVFNSKTPFPTVKTLREQPIISQLPKGYQK